jgi:hypothetical protein
MFFPK